MAIGLPIKMVILTIVGMVGLAAILAVISGSESAMLKPMHANINCSSLIMLSESPDIIELPVEVINSRDGTPVVKANAALCGLDATAINTTDSNGNTVLRFDRNDLELTAHESYLTLRVTAAGFREYVNEYAIKIVR